MASILRKTLKGTAYTIGTVVGAAALYYGVAQVLSRLPS